MLTLVLAVTTFMMPMLTAAQYRWTLNGMATALAGSYYFSSNFLTDYTDDDSIRKILLKWNGKDLEPDNPIQIRNYENTLLANIKGQDVNYDMEWTAIPEFKGTEASAYTFTVYKVDADGNVLKTYTTENNKPITQAGGNVTITTDGSIIGKGAVAGTPQAEYYIFDIKPVEGSTLPSNGSTLTIQAIARNTASDAQFSRTIACQFVYTISADGTEVRSFQMTDNGTQAIPSTNATLNFKIGELSTTKNVNVIVWWRDDKLGVLGNKNYLSLPSDCKGTLVYTNPDTKVTTTYYGYSMAVFEGVTSLENITLEFTKVGSGATDEWFQDNTLHVGGNSLPVAVDGEYDSDTYIGYYVYYTGKTN